MTYTKNSMSVLSVRILEPGTWKNIFQSRLFEKKKKKKTLIHIFFRERTNNILSISRCNCWEIYKRLNFPDLSGNCSLMNCWKRLHRRCLVRKVFPPPEIQLHFQRFSLLQLKNWLGHILPKILVRSVSRLLLLSQLFFVLSQRRKGRKEHSLTTRD